MAHRAEGMGHGAWGRGHGAYRKKLERVAGNWMMEIIRYKVLGNGYWVEGGGLKVEG